MSSNLSSLKKIGPRPAPLMYTSGNGLVGYFIYVVNETC